MSRNMESNTTDESPAQTPAQTPFREKALIEQQWRERLILNSTPGLNRRSGTARAMSSKINSDSEGLKAYLRDLSSMLVSQQKTNLTGFLEQEEDSLVDVDNRIESNSANRLSRSVFEQLHAGDFKLKIRKIDPVVIKDEEKDIIWAEDTASIAQIAEEELDYPQVNPADTEDPGYHRIEPNSFIPKETNDLENKPTIFNRLDSDFNLDVGSHSDSAPDSDSELDVEFLDPLTISQLKRLLRHFLSSQDIKLATGSWKLLQNASEIILKKIGQDLIVGETMVSDRQNILKVFERYKITSIPTTNDDFFQLCCNYLPLEDLNALETYLFL